MTNRRCTALSFRRGLLLALWAGSFVGAAALADDHALALPPVDALIADLGLIAGETPVRERADWAPLRKVLVPDVDPQVLPQLRAANAKSC